MGRGLRRNIYNVGVNGSRQLLKILPDKGMQVRPSGANKEKEGIFDGSQRIDDFGSGNHYGIPCHHGPGGGLFRQADPEHKGFDLAVSHKAGALGITSYEDKNGIEYYVMIVAHLDGENTVYHVYRALASNGIENARFSEVGSSESDKDFQGFGLITEDGTNDIYMIGLWSPSEGVTFADYAYLYQLNTETWTIGEALQQIHMVSVGGMAGMMGVHFRYGANVYVADDGTLTLSATERNSVLGSSLATNDWIPAIVN